MAIGIVKKAKFTLGGTQYDALVSSAEIQGDQDEPEITNFDSDSWKEYLAGLKSYQLTIEVMIDTDTSTIDLALWNAWVNGTNQAWTLKGTDAATAATNVEYSGTVLPPKYGFGGKVGDVRKKSLTLRGTGAIARATA